MLCQECGSGRVAHVNAKCSDLCTIEIGDNAHDGYVPEDAPFGKGTYGDSVKFDICLDCGRMQGEWPASQMDMEVEDDEG